MRRTARALVAALVLPLAQVPQAVGPRGAIVTVDVRPTEVTVGEPFTVRVRVRAPKIATIRFPAIPDSADAIEAVDPRSLEEGDDATVLDRTAIYRLVAWDVGVRTPVFGPVIVSSSGIDQSFPVTVSPVMVRSLLPADSALRVPKAARAPEPVQSGLWRYWLLLGLFVVGLAWYLVRRRRVRRRETPAPEALVAATTAFKALDPLALVEAGEPGRHLIAHVDVLRAYIARRFPAANGALTADEFAAALMVPDFPADPARVRDLLSREEAVRFAGAPIAGDAASALALEARTIVNEIQAAYEARMRAADRGPQRVKRK